MAGDKTNEKITLTLPREVHARLFRLAAEATLARSQHVTVQELIREFTRAGIEQMERDASNG